MRVLAVVYCLPPLLVPAAMCYLKLLLGLRERGVEVEALAIRPETFAAPLEGLEDPTLTRLLPEDFVVHWVRSPEMHPLVRLLKRSKDVERALYRMFEPRKREWIWGARKTLAGLDLSRYDVILSCSQPHANHLLGLELKERLGRPWVAYFSDPWSRNPYAPPASSRVAAYHRSLESRVLMAADRVLYTSPEMERLAREEFPEVLRGKTGVVPHGFVPDWYDLISLSPSPAGPLRVLHTGHFYGPRTPRPLLQALERLNGDHLEDRLVFSFYGSFPEVERNALRGTPLERAFQIHGTVPYLESLAYMRQHDMLLLVDAPLRDQAESVFLPSKLVDYLGSGKPVMAISPMEGATARVVRQVGGYLCDVGDVDGIHQCLAEVLNGRSLRTPDPGRAAEYHYLNTADRMLEYLKSC